MDLEADDPTTLGRYRVLGRLGAGDLGRVLLGVDDTGRRAALTLVHPELAADPGFRDRFRHEVQLAATAPPWFTAPVLDAEPDAEQPWLATAYVEGPSLQSYVEDSGPLGEHGTIALAVRMADGLVALHGAGLVHRDLKPSNVLLAEDGPRLINIGMSRSADPTALARSGHVLATPAFMSPEQVVGGRDAGPESDVFSFGSLIGFAATGRSPFAADTTPATLDRVVRGEPDLGPIHGELRAAVLGCLAKDPAMRPTAAQVRDLLRALDGTDHPVAATAVLPVGPPAHPAPGPTVVGPPVRVQPPPDRDRSRRWLPLAVLGAALAGVLITLAAVWFLSGRGQGPAADPVAAPPAGAQATSSGSAASASPTTGAGPSGSDDATVIDAETDDRFGTDGARFATPSRNIACAMTTEEVRCDVLEQTWQLPPAPADCQGDFGSGAVLAGRSAGELSCASDTVADPALEVLDYGEGVRFAGVVCVSRETGLRCENPDTGHGFSVARASYELF